MLRLKQHLLLVLLLRQQQLLLLPLELGGPLLSLELGGPLLRLGGPPGLLWLRVVVYQHSALRLVLGALEGHLVLWLLPGRNYVLDALPCQLRVRLVLLLKVLLLRPLLGSRFSCVLLAGHELAAWSIGGLIGVHELLLLVADGRLPHGVLLLLLLRDAKLVGELLVEHRDGARGLGAVALHFLLNTLQTNLMWA